MRSALVIFMTAISWQLAYADSCPNVVSTPQGSFNLRAFINLHGDQALAQARGEMDGSPDCGTAGKSRECKASTELSAKVVDTLVACTNTQSKNHDASGSPVSNTNNLDSTQKSEKDLSKAPKTKSLAKNNAGNDKPNGTPSENIEANGCSYLTQYVPGAFHKPNTYVCIGGGTKICEIMGKNSKQVTIYDWIPVSDSSCIHLDGWIDINAVELNTLNSRKNAEPNKPK